MKTTAVFLLVLFVASVYAQEQNDIEAVLDLLRQLKQQSLEELEALMARWDVIVEREQAKIQDLTDARMEQSAQCEARNQDVFNKLQQIHDTHAYIDWMQTRQLANSQRVELLSQLNCENNINYIDSVKNAKIFLSIIEYFRKALKYFAENESSFAQVNSAEYTIHEISKMVQVYEEHRQGKISTAFLEQFAREITSKSLIQTGDEPMTVQVAVGQLLEILDSMEQQLQADIADGQDDQVQSGVTFADFKARIEKENEIFDKMKEQQNNLIEHYARQLVTLNNRVDKCNERLQEMKNTVDGTVKNFNEAHDAHLVALKRVQDELDLWDELYNMYAENVVDATTDDQRAALQNKIDEQSQKPVIVGLPAPVQYQDKPEPIVIAPAESLPTPQIDEPVELTVEAQPVVAPAEPLPTPQIDEPVELTVEAQPVVAPAEPLPTPQIDEPEPVIVGLPAPEPEPVELTLNLDDPEVPVPDQVNDSELEVPANQDPEVEPEEDGEKEAVDYTDVEENNELWGQKSSNTNQNLQIDNSHSLQFEKNENTDNKREGSLEIAQEGSVAIEKEGSLEIGSTVEQHEINAADQPNIDDLWV